MAKEADYKTVSAELDEVLFKLQQQDVRVDEAVTLYEKGLGLVSQLEKHLEAAENKIEKLTLAATKAEK